MRTTRSDPTLPVAKNLLKREFDVSKRDRVWASDVTYVPTAQGWLFLAVVIDLFSRRVVGWATSDTQPTELVLEALRMAITRRSPSGNVLHHSDRGCQYASADYRKVLAANGMTSSMSRRGNCWDNAVVESFFGTLKAELHIEAGKYASRAEARSAIADYIENFYNSKRRHSSLGYLSPVDYEAAARMGRAA